MIKQLLLYFVAPAVLFSVSDLSAQGYQALHGSPLAGSTAVFNNPAASVGSAYKWDLSLFSVQAKISSNSPYIQSGANGGLTMTGDVRSKFIHANLDLSLLNFLYKPDNDHAFNFGIRARSYNHVKTTAFRYTDSINSIHSFFIANDNVPYLEGFTTHTGWLEADLNYSQVLFENSRSKLTGGATLQIMKGLSGAFLKLNKVSYIESKNATDTLFNFTDGSGSAGYSSTWDQSSLKDANKNALTSFGLSIGIEYMIYNNEYAANNNLNYDWKIGVSLMDIGSNKFKPSSNSVQLFSPSASITDVTADQKFTGAPDISAFKDSLTSVFTNSATITNNFSITNPTRLIVNVDRNFGNNFYINGELSMNFFSTSSYTKYRTRELNLLTITPRWETIGWGAYLPIQYNTQGQIWVGAAVKLGPLVLGLHSLGILAKNPTINGGGYLLLSIHPFNKRNVLSKMDCPK
jgi:hypothetical protein